MWQKQKSICSLVISSSFLLNPNLQSSFYKCFSLLILNSPDVLELYYGLKCQVLKYRLWIAVELWPVVLCSRGLHLHHLDMAQILEAKHYSYYLPSESNVKHICHFQHREHIRVRTGLFRGSSPSVRPAGGVGIVGESEACVCGAGGGATYCNWSR